MIVQYQISLVLGILFYLFILIVLIIRKKINVRYSILWFSVAGVMLVLAIFPQLIAIMAEFMGIASPANLVFVFQGFFVLLIVIYLTSIVSWLTNRLHRIVQTQALLEKRLRDLEDSQNIS